MTIRTILVDDEPLAIQGLELRLEKHDDVEIVETCSNGREAIRAIKTAQARPRLPRHPDAGLRRLLGDPGADGGRAAALRLRHRLYGPCDPSLRGAGGRLSDEAGRGGPAGRHARPRAPAAVREERAPRKRASSRRCSPRSRRRPPSRLPPPRSRRRPTATRSSSTSRIAARFSASTSTRIEQIDAAGDYMCIYTGDNTLILRETMKDLEKRLDPRRFQRVHRARHRQSRPGPAGEAAHQRRMLPGAGESGAR